jgi:uroporphyrinogen decarboxylase
LVAPWAQGAFNSVSFYRKLDNLIQDAYFNASFYHHMMTYFQNRMLKVIEQFAGAGADLICGSGNVANGTMAGPQYFNQFVLPYEIDFTTKVKDMGVYYLYHNCGDASSLLNSYSAVKMDIYESLTAPPYGDTILEEALEKIESSITLCGNIDQIDFLKKAKERDISEQIKKTLELVKSRGNFILGTSDYLSEGTPYENIRAMAAAGREYGWY